MSINEKQDEIIEEFDLFDDPLDKTQYIIDLGKKLPPMPDAYKTDANRIPGCQSKVWLEVKPKPDGRLHFLADAEPTAQISKGLVSLLIRVLSDEPADAVANAEIYFIERVGMGKLVTSLRAGGLASMLQKMKLYGKQYANEPANAQ